MGKGGSGPTPALSVVYGGTFDPEPHEASELPEQWMSGAPTALEAEGDFDGDGAADLTWVGAGADEVTAVQVMWGGGGRWADGCTVHPEATLTARMPDYLGSHMDAGDSDGDGCDNLFFYASQGAALRYGDAERWESADLDDVVRLEASGRNGGGGMAVDDLDGDGIGDLVFADVYESMSAVDQPGGFHIVYLEVRLDADPAIPNDVDATIVGPESIGLVYMGYRIAADDLDGDGFAEVVAGGTASTTPTARPGSSRAVRSGGPDRTRSTRRRAGSTERRPRPWRSRSRSSTTSTGMVGRSWCWGRPTRASTCSAAVTWWGP